MRFAAMIVWLATAGVGLSMLLIWLSRGALGQKEGLLKQLTPRLVFSHVGLAVLGLIVYVTGLITGDELLAWAAFGVLVVVGTLGSLEYYVWQKRRLGVVRATPQSWDFPPEAMTRVDVPAEQHFPASVVILHGILAVATVVLALLVAVGVDGGIDGPDDAAAEAGPQSVIVRGGETVVSLRPSTGCVAPNRPVTFNLVVRAVRRKRLPSGRKVRIEVQQVRFLLDGGRTAEEVDRERSFAVSLTERFRPATTHELRADVTYLQGSSPAPRTKVVSKTFRVCG
jgi:hypothetical protein